MYTVRARLIARGKSENEITLQTHTHINTHARIESSSSVSNLTKSHLMFTFGRGSCDLGPRACNTIAAESKRGRPGKKKKKKTQNGFFSKINPAQLGTANFRTHPKHWKRRKRLSFLETRKIYYNL